MKTFIRLQACSYTARRGAPYVRVTGGMRAMVLMPSRNPLESHASQELALSSRHIGRSNNLTEIMINHIQNFDQRVTIINDIGSACFRGQQPTTHLGTI